MRLILAVAFLAASASALAVTAKESLLSDSVDAKLPVSRQVLAASGKIFAGTVLRIVHRNADSSTSLATTRIVFRVNEAIRNVVRGQTIEVNEWAGLWQAGERYHAGERVLLFLYPPSRLGLTSPVGNHTGRFAVDRAGLVTLKPTIGGHPRGIAIRRVRAAIRQAERE